MPEEPRSIQDQLEELRDLAEENNKILKSMRRNAFIGGILKVLIWIAVLAASFYFTMQYIDPLLSQFAGMKTDSFDYQKLFEQYKSQFNQ